MPDFIIKMKPMIVDYFSKESLLVFIMMLLLLVFILLVLVYVLRKTDMVLKYGIFWDKNNNPHCPSCKIPLNIYGEYTIGNGFYCESCKAVYPMADRGFEFSVSKARKIMNKMK
ncbi:hypothetical protein [Seleniivibrio woodruffii]|uniref:hypothetical protein n=1 Tax=Seleniivibrio woodruffii TaxID=1078050 RepID=UPI0026F11A14|nr:hypothetical protein [Seleniivibrio woodruffii]